MNSINAKKIFRSCTSSKASVTIFSGLYLRWILDFINGCKLNTDLHYSLYCVNTQGHNYGIALRMMCCVKIIVRRKRTYITGNTLNTVTFTAQSIEWLATGYATGVWFPIGTEIFISSPRPAWSRTNKPSYAMDTKWCLFVKRPDYESDQ